jgi:hypothetical protein
MPAGCSILPQEGEIITLILTCQKCGILLKQISTCISWFQNMNSAVFNCKRGRSMSEMIEPSCEKFYAEKSLFSAILIMYYLNT